MNDCAGYERRVVLVIARRLNCDLLEQELKRCKDFRVSGATTEPSLGLDLVSQHRACVAVVDALLPDNGAFRCLDALRSREYYARSIVLGSGIFVAEVHQALCLDAAGFYTYDDPLVELAEGIANVAQGQYSFCRRITDSILVTPRGPRIKMRGLPQEFEELTGRELDVLACLVNGDTVRSCATRLDLSESTVDNHKTRLMRKLKTHRTVDLVKLAIRKRLIPDR